jgi:hypothetical protein
MFIRVVNVRWLVVPLTAFFLLFTGGVAVAPDCHIESAAPTKNSSAVAHNHSAAPHSHSHQSATSAVSNAQEALVASGKALNNEICFVIGLVVLLWLRYFHLKKSNSNVGRIPRPRFLQLISLPKNLGHLNLTHLQLGIIRI